MGEHRGVPDGPPILKGDLIEIEALQDTTFFIKMASYHTDKAAQFQINEHGYFDTMRMLRLFRGQTVLGLVVRKTVRASNTGYFECFEVLLEDDIIVLDPEKSGHGGHHYLQPDYEVRLLQAGKTPR